MSDLLKIKLTIANRVYPLSVAPEQEASLRASAKKIEATILQLEKNYAVRDKQDVLAMCALQYAAQLEQMKTNESPQSDDPHEKVKELIDMIEVHLAAY
ncbi:MAG: cell division protein ZapA [Flavobacteriaceae bacterium]|jgi:cell division protein ZapA (FtsZ GTPase activity inhibitor)|nr:cell division protein ZapA [Flavobacteriaceae bacterium]MDG1911302.1 cell division protein ZapA [Flavobacteriaceae bacterium]